MAAPRTTSDLDGAAQQLFTDLAAGDVEAVRAVMTPATADVLTAETLQVTWAAAAREAGAFTGAELLAVEQGEDATADPGEEVAGPAVVSLALHHEHGEWHGRVAYDGAARVIGLLVLPPGVAGPF